jgi:hypothetical protein
LLDFVGVGEAADVWVPIAALPSLSSVMEKMLPFALMSWVPEKVMFG